jgi:ABC-type multidrug transport system ATPase subunit
VRGLLRRLADEGTTVVFSSHDMIEVEELCTDAHGQSPAAVVVFSGSAGNCDRWRP